MKTIDRLNVNDKVGTVAIRIDDNNPMNREIIEMMIDNYKNVYCISICDSNDLVDNGIHDSIK